MIETILAREAIPEKRRYFSFKMAHGFGLATQDFNKIHEKIIYGFMLKGMLHGYASRIAEGVAPGMQCAEQRSRYEQVIPLNSGVVCFALDDIKREGDNVYMKVGLRLRSQTKTAAYSEMTFVPELPAFSGEASTPDEDAPLGHQITEEDAQRVAYALRKKGIDVPQLVAGLSSYSLWASGGNLVDQAKEKGFIPIYIAQTVRQYKGIETVKPGDKISITTAARTAAETARKRAARRGFEKTTATTPARMTTESGIVVVQEDLTLAFTKEHTIDEQLMEILAKQA